MKPFDVQDLLTKGLEANNVFWLYPEIKCKASQPWQQKQETNRRRDQSRRLRPLLARLERGTAAEGVRGRRPAVGADTEKGQAMTTPSPGPSWKCSGCGTIVHNKRNADRASGPDDICKGYCHDDKGCVGFACPGCGHKHYWTSHHEPSPGQGKKEDAMTEGQSIVERLRKDAAMNMELPKLTHLHHTGHLEQEAANEIDSLTLRATAAESRLETSEKACEQLIDERDAAEQSLSQAYYLVVGHSPEWSNLFGHTEALNEIADAVALLKDAAKQNLSRLPQPTGGKPGEGATKGQPSPPERGRCSCSCSPLISVPSPPPNPPASHT